MKKYSVSELRNKLQEVIDQVHYQKTPILVSKNRKPWVIIQAVPENDPDLKKMVKEH